MLYILKAPKHLLFHLILEITVKKPGRDVISALYTGEDLSLRDLGGHKATWLLSANSIYSNWSRLLDPGWGLYNFGVVSGDNTNRKNDPSITHWKQRNFKKSQSGLFIIEKKWMIAFILCYGLNPVPSNFICRSPKLPLCMVSQNVTPYWGRVFKQTIKLKCSHIGRS